MAQAAWQIGEKPLDRLENVENDRSWTICELLSSSLAPKKHIHADGSGQASLPDQKLYRRSLLEQQASGRGRRGSTCACLRARTNRTFSRLVEQAIYHCLYGRAKSCTLQLMDGERGRLMAEGEYKSMHALYTVAPDMVPEPLGWGTLEANPDGHFFLCEFVNLADEIPDPSLVCKKLAGLHKKSITMSPNGMYGFEVTTCNGTFPQDNRWNDSWEAFFAQQMDGAFKAEEEVQGFSEDYQRLLRRSLRKSFHGF
jgi:hypothetical protein